MNTSKHLEGKKILFLITQTKWGGAQKYVLQLAKYFAKKNEVHIAFGEKNNIDPRFIAICEKLNIKTIPVRNLVRSIKLDQDVFAISKILKLYKAGNYNLVHLNSSKAGLLGSVAAKLYSMNPMNIRLRVVYTAHGFVFNEPGPAVKKRMYKMSEAFSTGIQNLIITVSDFDRQSAIKGNVCPAGKMFTIHNGLDFSKYEFFSKEEARQKLHLDKDKKYFGTIASFYDSKGYRYLLEAIKKLKDSNSPLLTNHRWVWIGEGINLNYFKKLVEDNGLEKYIEIVKPTNKDWQYLKAFDYFILPSVKEGLPYTILEAGIAKVPIITTEVGGIPEILTNEKTGLMIKPADPDALIEAMNRFNKDSNLRETLVNNNYDNIKLNFSLRNTIRKTEETYLKLF